MIYLRLLEIFFMKNWANDERVTKYMTWQPYVKHSEIIKVL